MSRILLGIGPAGDTVEHVVRGEMHEARVYLTAGEREIANTQGVGKESGLRLAFGHVHLVVGGGIQNQGRIELGQGLFDALAVGDVDGLALESVYCKSARI